MQAAEYFDSIAQFWDMEYSDHEQAREITASISVPRGGGYALDIGCGSGGMILDLLRYGACEIEGIDFSEAMAEMARQKYSFDPRVRWSAPASISLSRSTAINISAIRARSSPRPIPCCAKADG